MPYLDPHWIQAYGNFAWNPYQRFSYIPLVLQETPPPVHTFDGRNLEKSVGSQYPAIKLSEHPDD
jgi:hypothetical protein